MFYSGEDRGRGKCADGDGKKQKKKEEGQPKESVYPPL